MVTDIVPLDSGSEVTGWGNLGSRAGRREGCGLCRPEQGCRLLLGPVFTAVSPMLTCPAQ